jgi:YesN/AraC family two-component response regulator
MPSMSGFQLCKEIKKRDSQVKIIIISAFELYNEKFKPDLDDIECFIQKPIDTEELIHEVQVAIGDEC